MYNRSDWDELTNGRIIMVKVTYPQDNKLNEKQTAAIAEGAEWVKNWYQQRNESGHFTELSEHPEFEEVMSRAENVQVIVADDMYTALEQALERGDLHFKDEILLLCGGKEMALEAFKKANQKKRENAADGDMVIGGISVSRYIDEPVIVFNQAVLPGLSPEEIESLVVHEMTHVVEAKTSEMMSQAIHGDYGNLYDEYADNPKEMYARLMQLRHHFNLAPDHECTEEDVARMREECAKRREEFAKKNEQDAAVPEYVDFMMFDRYSDTEILLLLNYTSENIMPGQEHIVDDRALLADNMRRDFALVGAKERAFDRSAAAQPRQVSAEPEKDDHTSQAVELDARLISRLTERQYS